MDGLDVSSDIACSVEINYDNSVKPVQNQQNKKSPAIAGLMT